MHALESFPDLPGSKIPRPQQRDTLYRPPP